MRHSALLFAVSFTLAACGGGDFSAKDNSSVNGAGNGGDGAGGGASGGSTSTGGSSQSGTGGAMSTGGATNTGGAMNTGGGSGSGGTGGSGGGMSTGGTGTGGGMGTGGTNSGIQCTGDNVTFPEFDRTCTADGDCLLVWHTTDCCGGQLAMGINHNAQSAFQEAEQICSSQYPACGCAAATFQTEDGTVVPVGLEDSAIASCKDGQCRSEYGGNTFTCGTTECADFEFCSVLYAGPSGTAPSYSCGLLPLGCADCTCAGGAVGVDCQCAADGGQVIITCAAP